MNQERAKKHSLVGGLILLTIGIIFLLRNFGLIPVGIGKLWPLVLVAIGIGLILQIGKKE